jgi:hypothetical protein
VQSSEYPDSSDEDFDDVVVSCVTRNSCSNSNDAISTSGQVDESGFERRDRLEVREVSALVFLIIKLFLFSYLKSKSYLVTSNGVFITRHSVLFLKYVIGIQLLPNYNCKLSANEDLQAWHVMEMVTISR